MRLITQQTDFDLRGEQLDGLPPYWFHSAVHKVALSDSQKRSLAGLPTRVRRNKQQLEAERAGDATAAEEPLYVPDPTDEQLLDDQRAPEEEDAAVPDLSGRALPRAALRRRHPQSRTHVLALRSRFVVPQICRDPPPRPADESPEDDKEAYAAFALGLFSSPRVDYPAAISAAAGGSDYNICTAGSSVAVAIIDTTPFRSQVEEQTYHHNQARCRVKVIWLKLSTLRVRRPSRPLASLPAIACDTCPLWRFTS